MTHILNVKMRGKDLLYIFFKMRLEDKPHGINFELGVYLQIVLQLENLVVNYLQLEGSFYIFYHYFYFCKLYDSIGK
jgi:hypothetical protein